MSIQNKTGSWVLPSFYISTSIGLLYKCYNNYTIFLKSFKKLTDNIDNSLLNYNMNNRIYIYFDRKMDR